MTHRPRGGSHWFGPGPKVWNVLGGVFFVFNSLFSGQKGEGQVDKIDTKSTRAFRKASQPPQNAFGSPRGETDVFSRHIILTQWMSGWWACGPLENLTEELDTFGTWHHHRTTKGLWIFLITEWAFPAAGVYNIALLDVSNSGGACTACTEQLVGFSSYFQFILDYLWACQNALLSGKTHATHLSCWSVVLKRKSKFIERKTNRKKAPGDAGDLWDCSSMDQMGPMKGIKTRTATNLAAWHYTVHGLNMIEHQRSRCETMWNVLTRYETAHH